YDTRLDIALFHREGVHHPGHDPGACAYVGRGDVDCRADQVKDLRDVAASNTLQLALRQVRRIARHAALGATKRYVNDGAPPGHPRRKRLAVVEIDIRVITNAAFAGSARVVVDDAVAVEDLQVPIIHHHRH